MTSPKPTPSKTSNDLWNVYIVECGDSSLYTGVTTDVGRRVKEHNSSKQSARYTRARQPVELVYQEFAVDRSEACKREYAIKQLTRAEKKMLIKNQ